MLTGKHAKRGRANFAHSLDVRPVFKRIDTCAAEFASPTAYMYSTYETPFVGAARRCEARSVRQQEGHHPRRRPEPHRPGHRVRLLLLPRRLRAARRRATRSIMVNCNPETVSTDYDTSDRLYFEPLTAEDVLEIIGRAVERHAPRRHRAVRRPDAARSSPTRSRRPACRSSAPRPTRSISPRTATVSSSCSIGSISTSRSNGIAYSVEQARLVADRSRLPAGRAPVLRARRPRHADRPRREPARRLPARHAAELVPPTSSALSERQDRPDQHGARQEPAAVRPLPHPTPSRSTSTASATARTSSSPASWSTSRKPASIPATAPARCRRTRCAAEMIDELERQTARARARRSRSAA